MTREASCRLEVPYLYQGIAAPRCHVACLRMVLQFHGLTHTASYLMNLSGYNYGFTYFRGARRAIAGPATARGPWGILSYAAEKLGCTTEFFQDRPWAETFERMKGSLRRGLPVYVARLDMRSLWETSQPVPHVVVLCGYDEARGVVLIHDPALGEVGEGIPYLSPNGLAPGTSGRYLELPAERFAQSCALEAIQWAFSGANPFCVIRPPEAPPPPIPWGDVLARNALLLQGMVEEATSRPPGAGRSFGPEALEECADELEEGFGLLDDPAALLQTLRALLGLAFRSGSSYVFDASCFVGGVAAATSDPELLAASQHLGAIALGYDRQVAQVEALLAAPASPGSVLREGLSRTAESLREVAGHARAAAESLHEGSRALR